MNVTASVSTKDRYATTLPLLISGICAQTVKPKQLIIFDDGEMKDIRGVSPYNHLFPLLMHVGISWYHLPGARIGQVRNHQTTLERADTELVWRLDDDNIPDPGCLENLLKVMEDPTVGAAGGLVHDPKYVSPRPGFVTGKIEDIFNPFNLQWYEWSGEPEDVDHLYSTFVYRVAAARKAGGYPMTLSPVGHREETTFTHQIKRAGYRIVVTPRAKTWHLREATGGIRSYKDASLWDHDEAIFWGKLSEWGVPPREYQFVVLDNGLGDHLMFRSILPDLIRANPRKRIVIANCYPQVFKRFPDVVLASIADAKAAFGNLNKWDIYRWGEEHGWKRSLVEAFREMYGLRSSGSAR